MKKSNSLGALNTSESHRTRSSHTPGAHKSASMRDLNNGRDDDSCNDNLGAPSSAPSRAHTPYLITQRKDAAASLFSYDADAPEEKPPVRVVADEMVELVKKQNRENRKRLKEEKRRSEHVHAEAPIGHRLFDARLQSVSVEGDHLARSSQAEIFRRTQAIKNDLQSKARETKRTHTMAGMLNTKFAVVLTQMTEGKARQMKKEEQGYKSSLVAQRKRDLQTARLKVDAKAERKILEKRRSALSLKSKLGKALTRRRETQSYALNEVRRLKRPVKRTSISFTPARQRTDKKEKYEQFSKSLETMLEVRESRRGMKTVLSASSIPIDGEELFESELEETRRGDDALHAKSSPAEITPSDRPPSRPKSRGELMPQSMFSAERIYDKGRNSPLSVPFGSRAARGQLHTPASILREIRSPDARLSTGGNMMSSPTSWA